MYKIILTLRISLPIISVITVSFRYPEMLVQRLAALISSREIDAGS